MEAKYDETRARLAAMTDDELVEVAKKENAWSSMAIEMLEARGYEVSETFDADTAAAAEKDVAPKEKLGVRRKRLVEHRVVVTKIDLSFWNTITLVLQVALAAIPATIFFGVIMSVILGGMGGCLWRLF